MLTFSQWSPLLVGLIAPLLAWLVAASGTNMRRAALLVALAAVLTLLILLAIDIVIVQVFLLHRSTNYEAEAQLATFANLATTLTTLLAVAAWTLLFVTVARVSDRTRLIVLAVVFGLVLALQAGVDPRQPALSLRGLVASLESNIHGEFIHLILLHLAAVVAPIGALLAPAQAAASAAGVGVGAGAATGAPSTPNPLGS